MTLPTEQIESVVRQMQEMALFVEFKPEQLKAIASVLEIQTFKKDTWIIDEGKPVRTLYLLAKGRTGIYRHKKWNDTLLASQNPPDFFGEFSMFDQVRPTASVKAEEDCEAYVLTAPAYETLTQTFPELPAQFKHSTNLLKSRRLWHLQ